MLAPGQLVDGKYRIVSLLGEGGIGLVYVAEHERLARTVALKVMRTQSSAEVLERFKREAKALARVNSPYVAEALDADVLSDGSPFLVMSCSRGAIYAWSSDNAAHWRGRRLRGAELPGRGRCTPRGHRAS